jgi:hypothetical protein
MNNRRASPVVSTKFFVIWIDATYSALPKYADYSQYQDVAECFSNSILFTAAASRGVLTVQASPNKKLDWLIA